MKIFKYITKEFAVIFTSIILLLVIMYQIINLTENVRKLPTDVPFKIVLKWIFFKSFFTGYLLIPIASIVSASILLIGMNEKNELVAIFTSGIDFKKLLLPFIFLGTIVSILLFSMGEFLIPEAESTAQKIYYTQIKKIPYKFSKINKIWIQGKNCLCKADLFLIEDKALKNLTIIKFDDRLKPISIEHVSFATFLRGKWLFLNSQLTSYQGRIPVTKHFKYRIANHFPYDIKSLTFLKQNPQEMNFIQLTQYIFLLKKNGYVYPYLIAGLIEKFSIPLINLLLFIIPLGIITVHPKKKKPLLEFSISVLIGLFYFGMLLLSSSMVNKGMDPYIMSIFPPFLIFIFTFFLIRMKISTF